MQPLQNPPLGYEAKLHVDHQTAPKFCRARHIPYVMRAKVEEEIQRLVTEGILEPVQYADWTAPIVLVISNTNGLGRLPLPE